MTIELDQKIEMCSKKINSLNVLIPIKEFKLKLEELDYLANKPDIWSNPQKASSLMKERQKISYNLDKINSFQEQYSFLKEYYQECPDDEYTASQINNLYQELSDFEFKQILNQPTDDSPAILTINAGSGGLESANWVTILLRMYLRWADTNGFKTEILDEKPSEEHSAICTDSVSIRIEGSYAYGFLKKESGVHRLIRKSPFSSAGLRHTSFAAVSVTADIEDIIDVKIEDKDIEVTAQTAGGPGGQNQNRIKSAIRIKHIPTGINIIVRTERDQLANKKTAFKMLKSKLYEIEMKKRQAEIDAKLSLQDKISFGSQIRSYILDKPQLIKDHRSEFETNDVDKFLDGDIGDCLIKSLLVK